MGWTHLYNCPDKSQIVNECTKNQNTHVCVAKSVHGNNLWTIWKNTITNKQEIVLFKLSKSEGSWGYKDISESMGPAYYDCPESFLALVPGGNESWREKVRVYHAKEKKRKDTIKSLKIGSMVRLEGCKPSEFRVTSLNPLRGTSSSGLTYKLTKTRITEIF